MDDMPALRPTGATVIKQTSPGVVNGPVPKPPAMP